jgi:hypothetical protein
VADGGNVENAEAEMTATEEEEEKPEPFKDYIHVRARRGQATDSHSLAERVRYLTLLAPIIFLAWYSLVTASQIEMQIN